MTGFLVLAALLALIGLWVVLTTNSFIRARKKVDEAWSGIDVQLKRRHDLVPNLVETVKGYAAHERETLSDVTEARLAAVEAGEPRVVERAGQRPFGGGLLGGAARGERGVARLHDRLERAALMGRVALHGLHEIGNEIVPLLQLDVDIGEGLGHALPQRDEPVVGDDAVEDDRDDDREKDPFHAASPCDRFAWAGT